MPDYAPFEEPGRKHPARGVLISSQEPTIVFLTVCTKDRQPWLARQSVHDALKKIWLSTDTWLVGDYLLMPDHIHLFCAPRDLTITLQRWVSFWKREFSCLICPKPANGCGISGTCACAAAKITRRNGIMSAKIPRVLDW